MNVFYMKYSKTAILTTTLRLISFVISLSVYAQIAQAATIPNVLVQDQNGLQKLFYDDLIKDKLVAINFIFTRCQMICPISGYKFGLIRKAVKNNPDIELGLISVTTDAVYDTAERLKDWADKFGAGPGWLQVTGDKLVMDGLLKNMQAFSVDKLDHTTLILLVNGKLGQYKWVDGNSSVDSILLAAANW